MIRLRLVALAFLYVAMGAAKAQIPGLPVVDFQRYFPHITAVSEEKVVKEFPEGVQYKFLTVRDETEKVVIVALTRKEGKDRLVRVFLAKGPIAGSEETLRKTVAKFADTIGMNFEFIDLRNLKSFEEFEIRAKELGWGLQAQSK
jgi:hypothetical protein